MTKEELLSKESSLVKCKSCDVIKKRYLRGLFPNGKDKIWVDEDNRQFNGRTCPECDNKKKMLRQKTKRRVDKIRASKPYTFGDHL